jgi:hypothetical protein
MFPSPRKINPKTSKQIDLNATYLGGEDEGGGDVDGLGAREARVLEVVDLRRDEKELEKLEEEGSKQKAKKKQTRSNTKTNGSGRDETTRVEHKHNSCKRESCNESKVEGRNNNLQQERLAEDVTYLQDISGLLGELHTTAAGGSVTLHQEGIVVSDQVPNKCVAHFRSVARKRRGG